jgi:hypothetical protein
VLSLHEDWYHDENVGTEAEGKSKEREEELVGV